MICQIATAAIMAPVTTPLGEMFMFTVETDGMSLEDRRSLLDWVIRPALRAVPGVADVNALGGKVRSFEVVPDPVKLSALGVSTAQLKSAIEANNRNDGAGRLGEGGEVLLVRSEGNIKTADDLRAIVVSRKDGNLARLGDVAQVRDGSVTRYGVVTKDGKAEAVEGLVLGLAGANAQKVVEGVTAKLAELKPTLPKGVEIKVFYNRAELVKKAVGTVSTALIEATLIVITLMNSARSSADRRRRRSPCLRISYTSAGPGDARFGGVASRVGVDPRAVQPVSLASWLRAFTRKLCWVEGGRPPLVQLVVLVQPESVPAVVFSTQYSVPVGLPLGVKLTSICDAL